MERVNENVAWSSRDMMDMASYSKDEFDIVGEGEIDDAEEEMHLETLLPSVHTEPIVECSGLSKLKWVNLEVVLLNESGVPVAEGVCHNTHPHDCVDQYPLGNKDVGVVIIELFVHSKVHPTQCFLLCRW